MAKVPKPIVIYLTIDESRINDAAKRSNEDDEDDAPNGCKRIKIAESKQDELLLRENYC